MNSSTLKPYLPNALAMSIVIGYYLAEQYLELSSAAAIFKEVDFLTGNIILVIIAITIGLFVPQYWLVFFISCVVLLAIWARPDMAAHFNSTPEYISAVVLVILGFSSISNFSRHYRSAKNWFSKLMPRKAVGESFFLKQQEDFYFCPASSMSLPNFEKYFLDLGVSSKNFLRLSSKEA